MLNVKNIKRRIITEGADHPYGVVHVPGSECAILLSHKHLLITGHPVKMTAVGFEPTPLRTGALSQRLRPLGQTALLVFTEKN